VHTNSVQAIQEAWLPVRIQCTDNTVNKAKPMRFHTRKQEISNHYKCQVEAYTISRLAGC
jgi:hypothetical protein